MVEQKRRDISKSIETLNQAADEGQINFTRSLGRLLTAEDDERARLAIYESTYHLTVNGFIQIKRDILEGTVSREEIQRDIEDFKATVGMLQAPVKNWKAFKLGLESPGKTFYVELTEDDDEFDLSGDFGLPEDFGVMGVPILKSSEFVDFEKQKELFNNLLLSKLHLVPDEESLWEHPRAVDFTFDFVFL